MQDLFCLAVYVFRLWNFRHGQGWSDCCGAYHAAGLCFMGLYLWRKNYLTGDKHLYSPVSVPYLAWSLLAGMTSICIIGLLMSELTFLPNLLDQTFDILQSGWLGILCISVLGPYWKNCFSVVPLPRSCFADIARQRLSLFPG